jgi:flagellar biosynthesis chaperone FliJ
MAVSRAMRRLLHIREIEEEQSRTALAAAVSDLRRLQAALLATFERDRRGRKLVVSSVTSGELADRLAGLEETRLAKRHATALAPRIVETERNVAVRRQELLGKRIEYRQVETLIQKVEEVDALDASRRSQHELDDWFLGRAVRVQQSQRRSESSEKTQPK